MPHGDTFPFHSFSIQLKDGERVEVGEADTKIALQYSATVCLST
jgi:hypothetical protein